MKILKKNLIIDNSGILIRNKRKKTKSTKEQKSLSKPKKNSKNTDLKKGKYFFNMNYSKYIMKNGLSPSKINSLTLKFRTSKNSEKSKISRNERKTPNNKKIRLISRKKKNSKKIFSLKNQDFNFFKENEFLKINKKNKVLKKLIKKLKNEDISKSPVHKEKMNIFSRLRIISKDNIKEKSSSRKKIKLNFEKKKNTLIIKKNNKKKLKMVELYKKLQRVPNKEKAKSNDIKRKKKIKISNFRKKGKFLSEDKDQNRYIISEKVNYNIKKNQKQKKEIKSENKYYKQLLENFNQKEGNYIKTKIQKKFKKWKKYDLAELFEFKTTINFYKIKKQIGKGCFGRVYLATQILTNSEIALKVIDKKTITNKESKSKIEKEVKILKMVNKNKYIIKLFEVFEDNNYVYMAFELMPNGDLVQFFKKRSLFEESQLIPFFKKILKGVKYLHSKNIIHRDIKLDNILLDLQKNPKIIDFGISSIVCKDSRIYDTGGTPAYLAPEVIKSEGQVAPKSDIWSLGVLLYLLAYGVVPFQSDDIQKLYNKIIIGKFSFPKFDYSSIELIDLIKKMLVVDVEKRYCVDKVLRHPLFREFEKNRQNWEKENKEEIFEIDDQNGNFDKKNEKKLNKGKRKKNLMNKNLNKGKNDLKGKNSKLGKDGNLKIEDKKEIIEKNEFLNFEKKKVFEKLEVEVDKEKKLNEEFFQDFEEKKNGVFLFLRYLGFHPDFIEQSFNKNLFNHVKACLDVFLRTFPN